MKKPTSGLIASINKWGEEEGTKKFNIANEKRKISNSKKALEKKFGVGITKIFDSASLEFNIKKYGEIDGPLKYNEYVLNQKTKSNKSILYWLELGYTKDDAKKIIHDLQATFSLEICIKKYGPFEGRIRWMDRQEKWQETLNSKTDGEKAEINRKKCPGYNKKYFMSKAEKELCCILGCDSQIRIDTFWYDLGLGNKIIEYNGDYWHMNPVTYSKDDFNEKVGKVASEIWEKDKIKKDVAIENGYEILIIWETDYIKDKAKTIQKCRDFLNG